MADALLAAKAAGYDIEQTNGAKYDFHVVVPISGVSAGAPGGKVWLPSLSNVSLNAMEFGHALQSGHANNWQSSTIIGPGRIIEHGNPFDNLGKGTAGTSGHYNTRMKHRMAWLTDNDITTVTQSGTYRIQTHDASLASGNKAALRIRLNDELNYWVEYRGLFPDTSNGALIMWGWNDWGYYSSLLAQQTLQLQQTTLLDMTPSTSRFTDAILPIGQTFTDSSAGITIRVLGKAGTVPEALDIQVTLNNPINTPIDVIPKLGLVYPVNDVSIFSGSSNVTFEVTASDPNVGLANGDGISNVVFEIYDTEQENPVMVSPAISSPPYTWSFNPTSLIDGGYVLMARATSTQAAGGNYNSLGTFFVIDNQ